MISEVPDTIGAENNGPCCAVTGSSGYLGSCLKKTFQAAGWNVIELCRNPSPQAVASGQAVRFQLGDDLDTQVLKRVNALVHCAYDPRVKTWREIRDINVRGAEQLFAAATRAGVERITVVSTMSAFVGCKSLYGRAKLQIEELAPSGSFVVRPGLIYGKNPQGMVGKLVGYVSKSRLAPALADGTFLYLTHELDLCRSILDFSSNRLRCCSEPVTTAHEQGWTLRQILEEIANVKQKQLQFVRVPWRLLWAVIRSCEAIGISLSFRSDSLISLVNQNRTPSFDAARNLGLAFRRFDAHSIAS